MVSTLRGSNGSELELGGGGLNRSPATVASTFLARIAFPLQSRFRVPDTVPCIFWLPCVPATMRLHVLGANRATGSESKVGMLCLSWGLVNAGM